MNMTGKKSRDRVLELLEMVELNSDLVNRYPQALSGGQKQRVNIARAIAAEPQVILCDEITASLDTLVAEAIIQLLKDLQNKLNVTYVFISHDLSTVASFADRIEVFYAGRVVESGTVKQVLAPPFHPYARLLLSSVPEMRLGWLDDVMQNREDINLISKGIELTAQGCSFANRCPMSAKEKCRPDKTPKLFDMDNGHKIACHLFANAN